MVAVVELNAAGGRQLVGGAAASTVAAAAADAAGNEKTACSARPFVSSSPEVQAEMVQLEMPC